MATAELISNGLGFPRGKGIMTLFGGSALGLTKDVGVVSDSLRYPSAPFLFYEGGEQFDVANLWGGLLLSGIRALYYAVPVSRSKWSENTPPGAMEAPQVAHGFLSPIVSLRWDRLDLELMRVSALELNWDGEGAEPVSQETIRTAQLVLELARETATSEPHPQIPLPVLFASVEGEVVLKWQFRERELKCIVIGRKVEAIRWSSHDQFESDGFWEIRPADVAEHFEWLVRQ
jgi:hypothetical protein